MTMLRHQLCFLTGHKLRRPENEPMSKFDLLYNPGDLTEADLHIHSSSSFSLLMLMNKGESIGVTFASVNTQHTQQVGGGGIR